MGQYLHVKAGVIFAMFGCESFSGVQAADSHKKLLIDFVAKLRSYKPNGEEFPRIVLFSDCLRGPQRRNLPRGKAYNKNLSALPGHQGCRPRGGRGLRDLFEPSLAIRTRKQPLTINGVPQRVGKQEDWRGRTQALLKKQIGARAAMKN